MTAPERLTEQLDAALSNYTAGIDCAVRFVTIEQVDMLAEFYLQTRRADLAAVPAQVRVKPLVALVEELTTAVWHLMDNSETSGPIDDPTITVWQPDFDTVCGLLDRIEGLSSGSTDDMTAGELLSANILAALAAAKEHAPTEYERKVSQMKKDFPNGI